MSYVVHNLTRTKTYRSWESMKQRCLNPHAPDYGRYGGRGITVCDRWVNSFTAFASDMGIRPDGKTLDRIDCNGNYTPENCRWATATEQQQNKTNCPTIEYDGRTISVAALAAELGLPVNVLKWRLNNSWDIDRAVNTPKFLRKGK